MIASTEAAVAAAERLKAQAGARVHRLGQPDELHEETTMPTGIYPRKPKAEKPAETTPEAAPAKKRGPKPKADKPAAKTAKPAIGAPIFSVDSTGAILIRRGDHGMEISREEAIALHDFMHKAEGIIAPEAA